MNKDCDRKKNYSIIHVHVCCTDFQKSCVQGIFQSEPATVVTEGHMTSKPCLDNPEHPCTYLAPSLSHECLQRLSVLSLAETLVHTDHMTASAAANDLHKHGRNMHACMNVLYAWITYLKSMVSHLDVCPHLFCKGFKVTTDNEIGSEAKGQLVR